MVGHHGNQPVRKLTFLVLAIAITAGGLPACESSHRDTDQPAASTAPSESPPTGESTPTCEPAPTGESTPVDDLESVDIQGIAVAPDGSVFVPDADVSRILRTDKTGQITHFAGEPGFHGFGGDGCPAANAGLFAPHGLAFDSAGNLYIADHGNERIRKIDQKGIITTVAGSLIGGVYAGDGGPATEASLQEPVAVAVDDSGQIFIADRDNFRVRKVDTDGTITTLAGNGTIGPDRIEGPAKKAALGLPVGVTVVPGGVVYISDGPAHRVYEVGADGVMTIFAGTGNAGYSGDGGRATDAELNGPYGLTTDTRGNVYIADYENHAIRVVDRKGTIRTVAGTGIAGFSGDGKPATKAQLNGPYAVAVDDSGTLYIADSHNLRVRRVDPAGKISTILP
jgi:sugar lactone lactonase YvrE